MGEAGVAPASNGEAVQNFFQIWGESFSQVLGQISGAAVPCRMLSSPLPDFPPTSDTDFWAVITAAGGMRGEMHLHLAAANALRLAQTFMSEALAPEAALTADHREAVIELLRQISGIVCSAAKSRWGEIQLRVELALVAPSWRPAETFGLQAGGDGAEGLALEFGFSAALVAELRAPKSESAKATTATSSVGLPLPAEYSPGALNLLLDVPLALTMRFGSRRLLLSEVLDLSPGAVVELDRRVQEPVDLLLDGRLVAYGEVVVIDGNYGLRVTDVFPGAHSVRRQDG